MLTLRCKMCGGSLSVEDGVQVAECEYCGTKQTLPKITDEKKAALFDRANQSRSMNEFDKAALIYENILSESPDEAEAYWGLCLCRYGIEYVVDPRTNKRVPTCHRTQFGSILQDKNYLAAIENADFMAREIYQQEATYIDTVQKNILAISSKEEPFDIFICYKETDERGERTIDSVIAQEIYDTLTEKGYKVFFARITLEDKLGTAYEPYIFAALNSSKIMLVVGTKPEHFEAVWVRNEWSRYLELIEQGEKKAVIPCYRNISPYDMPREFMALQSQDVSKVGYMQDLVRGIQKILGETKNAEKTSSTPVAPVETQPVISGGQIRIRSVRSVGASHVNDYWAKGAMTSTINRDVHPVISFQLLLERSFGFDGQIKLNFKVRDAIGNLVENLTTVVNVTSSNDRLAQTFVIRGNDGKMVQSGMYRAIFSVNDGPEFEYTFKVATNMDITVAPVSINGGVPNSRGTSVTANKRKSLLVYILLAIFFGSFGVHSFYVGKYGKGILQLLLCFTGISQLWGWCSAAKALLTQRVPTKY